MEKQYTFVTKYKKNILFCFFEEHMEIHAEWNAQWQQSVSVRYADIRQFRLSERDGCYDLDILAQGRDIHKEEKGRKRDQTSYHVQLKPVSGTDEDILDILRENTPFTCMDRKAVFLYVPEQVSKMKEGGKENAECE